MYTHAAFVVMIAATIMAGVAMTTGVLHLFRDVSPSSGVWRVAILHMFIQLSAGSLLLISLILRIGHVDDARPPVYATLLAIVGTVVLLFGGWLGGRMVYDHGVGVANTKNHQAISHDKR